MSILVLCLCGSSLRGTMLYACIVLYCFDVRLYVQYPFSPEPLSLSFVYVDVEAVDLDIVYDLDRGNV